MEYSLKNVNNFLPINNKNFCILFMYIQCPQIAKSHFIPIKIMTSWSDSISLITVTYAYVAKDKNLHKNNVLQTCLVRKTMNLLIKQWQLN